MYRVSATTGLSMIPTIGFKPRVGTHNLWEGFQEPKFAQM